MNGIVSRTQHNAIASMSKSELDVVKEIETALLTLEQIKLTTHHVINNGVYYRTIRLNGGEAIVGALIKIPTTVIISGHMRVHIGSKVITVDGYEVIPAKANRKQVMYALSDCTVTMCFATNATTVEEAEDEFTDESSRLISRTEDAINVSIIVKD